MAADPEFKQKVEELLQENEVLLFMKGTPEMPRCGFSMRVVGVLEQLGVEYGAVDVLPVLDPLREVTGEISEWRTFPQLYVNGELVGGCDIVEEMLETGELAELLGVEQPESAARAGATTAHRPAAEPAASSGGDQPSTAPTAQTVAARSAASSRTWNEEPQPHAATTFGLLTTKPAPWRPST